MTEFGIGPRTLWSALLLACFSKHACAYTVGQCLDEAARLWSLPPALLHAIARHESRKDPTALRRNRNGSIDIGLMQINSVHLPELARAGITAAGLRNPCVNALVGGYLLKRETRRFGLSREAIGAYHAPHAPHRWDAYAARIADALAAELVPRDPP